MPKFCPLCGQIIIKGPKRVCLDCGKPIKQHHKWLIGTDGRLHHRNCADPGNYPDVAGSTAQGELLEGKA
jgi:hypothetical protein